MVPNNTGWLGIGWTGAARDHVLSALATLGAQGEETLTELVGPWMDMLM